MTCPFESEKVARFSIALGERAGSDSLLIEPLADDDEHAALAFLATARSVQAVFMNGLIRDNGMESPFNRGVFYGARRREKELAGVGLIGHATLFETSDDAAIQAFARVAKQTDRTHVILGEEEKIKRFWRSYARGGQHPRVVCREMLFEFSGPAPETESVKGLRLATLDDLPFLMPIQACMAFEESGVDPLEHDPVGFRLRYARRIEQARVLVCIEDGRPIFKADILADTPRAVYLEGIYTSPEARRLAHGTHCLTEMARRLLRRTASVQLLVNEQNHKAQRFYTSAGFRFGGYYDTIFLQPAG